ncbi:hypothetical protein Tco_1264654 [Tanacetum coccineum]
MHNNIMEAGSKDRPPMLGPGRYAQWRSLVIEAAEATENSPAVPQHEEVETTHNMSAENKPYFHAEKEAIFLLLTGIGDEMYSTVDACKTANEMWIAIERLQQGESLNIQDAEDIDTVSYHKLFDIMKQYQKEANEIHAERIAKSENPLALVAAAQPYPENYHQATKPQRAFSPAPKHSYSTSSSTPTRHIGKDIAKPITPPSESDSDEDSDPEQA